MVQDRSRHPMDWDKLDDLLKGKEIVVGDMIRVIDEHDEIYCGFYIGAFATGDIYSDDQPEKGPRRFEEGGLMVRLSIYSLKDWQKKTMLTSKAPRQYAYGPPKIPEPKYYFDEGVLVRKIKSIDKLVPADK